MNVVVVVFASLPSFSRQLSFSMLLSRVDWCSQYVWSTAGIEACKAEEIANMGQRSVAYLPAFIENPSVIRRD